MTNVENPPKNRTGRRPGDPDTRREIMDAALELFAAQGFEKTSVRAVARAANVDPALVRHYFGDKGGLFVAAVQNRTAFVDAVRASLDEAGRTDGDGRGAVFARAYFSLWETPEFRPVFDAVVKAALAFEAGRDMMRTAIATIATDVVGDSVSRTGLALVGSQLLGTAIGRYVMEIPELVELDLDALVVLVAPALDAILAGDPTPA